MSKRTSISIKTKLAAALCQMLRPNDKGELVPVIDYESAKKMTADQVLSVWNWDHYPIPKHRDGPDEHWNLVPRPIMEHREKTATKDVPEFAKDKRITAAQEEHRRRMLAKTGAVIAALPHGKPKFKWPSRPMAGSKSSGWRKPLRGPAVRRPS